MRVNAPSPLRGQKPPTGRRRYQSGGSLLWGSSERPCTLGTRGGDHLLMARLGEDLRSLCLRQFPLAKVRGRSR